MVASFESYVGSYSLLFSSFDFPYIEFFLILSRSNTTKWMCQICYHTIMWHFPHKEKDNAWKLEIKHVEGNVFVLVCAQWNTNIHIHHSAFTKQHQTESNEKYRIEKKEDRVWFSINSLWNILDTQFFYNNFW